MSRSDFRGPKLPRTLLDQIQGGRVSKKRDVPRKDRRKQERQDRKATHSRPSQRTRPDRAPISEEDSEDDKPPAKQSAIPKNDAKPSKSILKRPPPEPVDSENEEPSEPAVSRTAKAKLEDDDAEIAALEKRLGLKKKKSKKTGDDGLDWLVFGSDGEDERTSKRKRPEDDEWLHNKRQKAGGSKSSLHDDTSYESEHDSDADGSFDEDLENPFSEDEISAEDEDDFEAFDDEDEEDKSEDEPIPVKQRENPYVAPVPKTEQPAKYIPPSLRQSSGTDDEVLRQLRRQIQGQLNRLSEANILSILQAMQEFYTKNARQHVTSTLIDLLTNLICDPSVLNDTFLVLHAGFAAAVYRTIGIDFGAQLLETVVRMFDAHYSTASEGKQELNLIAFLSNLYAFQLVGSEIMFDYIRMLLDKDNFSETSTELLLRIIRMTGTQLRQDDPSALKDIVLLLQKTVSAIGQDKVSVRTKFMIETIHNLKNNRMKTGVVASALTAEHMQRMKKTLGGIKNSKATEPLRIGLSDIRDSEKKGKWWLVGASWKDPAKMANGESTAAPAQAETDDAENDSDASDGDVDLDKLARAQGMNTDVRRAIFVAVAGAVDYQHAHMRIMKLNLKNKQLIEVPRVLVHCVGAEPVYNHFYTLVATKFCGDHKLAKAYQFALLDLYRRMGETRDGEDEDDMDTDGEEQMSVRKIYNIARMYSTLITEQLLHITILKPLNFGSLKPKTQIFVEALLSTIFNLLRKKAHKEGFEDAVKDVFLRTHAVPDMVPGLKYYLSNIVPDSEIAADRKEKKRIALGCEYAVEALSQQQTAMSIEDELSD
ncbi:hypothetical protein M409DRAFT_37712 [Zasmidium cellare ATCC 36951]|uniref:MI domain-containing protein n=1 Tax=Zasmidium cellare ATCC 36951 TaxID=1080233 RepID=A0A6A6C0M5_ZASCE|nr:uncharacterized protein M409DRAFT_37712 [Zasmidium cellare ATCC 36951]KAF2160604.1 hypothetical protein M409DRAFT_37712 [Zasmidium cellare ATCC 36951]